MQAKNVNRFFQHYAATVCSVLRECIIHLTSLFLENIFQLSKHFSYQCYQRTDINKRGKCDVMSNTTVVLEEEQLKIDTSVHKFRSSNSNEAFIMGRPRLLQRVRCYLCKKKFGQCKQNSRSDGSLLYTLFGVINAFQWSMLSRVSLRYKSLIPGKAISVRWVSYIVAGDKVL